MIIWIILFFLVVGLSFYLSIRSMKDFQDLPEGQYGLYLIQDLIHLNDLLTQRRLISLEKLFKGNKQALVIYVPRDLALSLSQLKLLEIEDPSDKISSDSVLAFETRGANLSLDLKTDEQLYFQLVISPIDGVVPKFQTTQRVVITSPDPNRRIELAKKVGGVIKKKSSAQVFSNFKYRSVYPLRKNILNSAQIWSLLNN